MIRIVELNKKNEKKWDEFVLTHADRKVVFLNGFRKTLEETYAYKTLYIMFIDQDGQIVGVFPNLVSKKINLKKKLISMPFSANGGFLFRDGLNKEQIREIEELFLDFCIKNEIDSIEIRGGQSWIESNASPENGYDYGFLKIQEPEKLLQNFHYSVRKAIKKAERFNLKCEEDGNEVIIKDVFYSLYLRSMRRFGTPPHSLSFFLNQYKYLKEFFKVFIVKYHSKPVSVLTVFVVNRCIELALIVSDEKYWEYRPNDMAHWSVIRWGYENNCRDVFFGPMIYPGQRQYKEKWGIISKKYFFYKLYPKIDHFKGKYIPKVSRDSFQVKVVSAFLKNVQTTLFERIGPYLRKYGKR